jgi:hypothetical protein
MRIQACCHMAVGNIQQARRFATAANGLPESAGDALGPFREGNKEWATRLNELLQAAERSNDSAAR